MAPTSVRSPGTQARKAKSKDSSRASQRKENEDEESFFGDYCLNCGEPCSGPSAYCSELCLEADATDAALATQQYLYSPALSAASVPALISSRRHHHPGPSSAVSSSSPTTTTTTASSLTSSPTRLALLSSGPLGALPLEEDVTDLDLGEGVLSGHSGSFSAFVSGTRVGGGGGRSTGAEDDQLRPNGYFSAADLAKLGVGTPGKSPARSTEPFASAFGGAGASPADTMMAPSLPPSTIRADPTPGDARPNRTGSGKYAGLPALFHHVPPNEEAPPSPAMKATLARPSVTTVATTRREPSRPAEAARGSRSDPAVLLATTARQRGASAEGRRRRDARASLVAALGSKGVGVGVGGGSGRSVSDIVTGGNLKAPAMSTEEACAGSETMSTSSGGSGGGGAAHGRGGALGKLADWQGRIRGVLLGRPALQGGRWGCEDSEDEMTGVAMALDKSTDSLASSKKPSQRRANTSPNLPRQPVRYPVGKGHRATVSESGGACSTASSSLVTTDAPPTPERSLSRGRRQQAVMMPLTDLASVAFAASPELTRGRSRRRGQPTAAMRSRSPDRSQSKSRPVSAGPEGRRAETTGDEGGEETEEEEEGGVEVEEEEGERGRGRGRKRSFGRDRSPAGALGLHVAASRPVGQYREGFGYYS